jgi:hypothetical protein
LDGIRAMLALDRVDDRATSKELASHRVSPPTPDDKAQRTGPPRVKLIVPETAAVDGSTTASRKDRQDIKRSVDHRS